MSTADYNLGLEFDALAAAAPAPPPVGLSQGHFRKVSGTGFGDAQNSYAYAYAWHNDHLYIGTSRNILVLIRKRFTFEVPMAQWPVEVPEEIDPDRLCGEIWRYSPATGQWDRCYHSTLTTGLDGNPVPVASGFRNMAVFQGRSDSRPCLYTIPSCGSNGAGVVLMRCEDGLNFETVSEPGMGLPDKNLASFRGVIAFKGRLFATPSGSRGANPNVSYNATIVCSDDPARGGWQNSNAPMFGDETNYGIHDMAVWGDWLYAGTMNIRHGCQVWKTQAEGPPPHRWIKVLDAGADRGPLNQCVVCMAAHGDALYVGTGIQNGGHDRTNHVGPAAGEVFRIYADDTWDLVMGQPRMTRYGLKAPSSGLGPGFDNPFAGYIWRMGVHDGVLYVGTYDSSSFMPYANLTPQMQRVLDPNTVERFLAMRGGCELWRSGDGDDWRPVTRNGFGNRYNFGVRAIVSTPQGLFVGTANPFGPRAAVRTASGWRYEDNPDGGTEIWQGRLEYAGLTGRVDPVAAGDYPAGIDIPAAWPLGKLPTPEETALTWPAAEPSASLTAQGEVNVDDPRALMDYLADRALPDAPEGAATTASGAADPNAAHPAYSYLQRMLAESQQAALDPVWQLARTRHESAGADDAAREAKEYFNNSPLRNVGYWRRATLSPPEASQLLVEEVLDLLPKDAAAAPRVLLLGSGGAEMAQQLWARQSDAEISLWAADRASAAELRRPELRKTGPRLNLLRGRSLAAALPAEAFDAVVWIEAAPAAQRGRALRAAAQALRPGGTLVGADLIGSLDVQEPDRSDGSRALVQSLAKLFRGRKAAESADSTAASAATVDDDPQTASLVKLNAELTTVGLSVERLIDITDRAWQPFYRHSRLYLLVRMMLLHLDQSQYDAIVDALPGGRHVVEAYALFSARRPSPHSTGDPPVQ